MSQTRKHNLLLDPEIPLDHRGRGCCCTCGVLGARGDAHHFKTDQDPTAALPRRPRSTRMEEFAEAARRREAAILGEKEDDE